MKRKLSLAFILFNIVCIRLNAQVTDTLVYLQTEVEAKKNLYIGQPFSVLLNDLLIQPVALYGSGAPINKNREFYTTFYYSEGGASGPRGTHYIDIEWRDIISRPITGPLQRENNWLFTTAVRNYYSDKVIKNIKVR